MYRQEEGFMRMYRLFHARSLLIIVFTQIGINYRGQPNELRGCINDARGVKDFLIRMSLFNSLPSD